MEHSPLGKLPPELRNNIYDLALPQEREITLVRTCKDDPWQPPALLQVCRQLRSEASSMFYSSVGFKVFYWSHLAVMLANLRAQDRSLISRIYLFGKYVEDEDEASKEASRFRRMLRAKGAAMDKAKVFVEVHKQTKSDRRSE